MREHEHTSHSFTLGPQDYLMVGASLILILLSILNMSTLLTERELDWEEHRILENIELPLLQYLPLNLGFGLYHKLSHWCMYRLFDHYTIPLRFPSILTGIITIMFLGFSAWKMFRSFLILTFAVFVVGLNWYFLEYTRWGLAGYSGAGLFYIVTFFYLWKIVEVGRLTRFDKLLVVCFCASGVFILFHTAIFVIVGPFSVLAFHFLRFPRGSSNLRQRCRCLGYFGAYPLVTVAIYIPLILIPRLRKIGHVHSADSYRPYLYYAYNDNYPTSVIGFFQFYYHQSKNLLFWSVRPIGDLGGIIGGVIIVLFFIGLLGTLRHHVVRSPRLFTVTYLFLALGVLILLNILEIYPYGNPRYAFFLIFPISLIAACGLDDAVSVIKKLFRLNDSHLTSIIVGLVLIMLGLFLTYQESMRRLDARDRVIKMIGTIRENYDLILVEGRYRVVARHTAPWQADKMYFLKRRMVEKREDPPDELIEHIRRSNLQRILTISRNEIPDCHRELLKTLQGLYVISEHINLHRDRSYMFQFQKYDIHAAIWKRHEGAGAQESLLLPTKVGVGRPSLNDRGELAVRGWILTTMRIEKIWLKIGDKVFKKPKYPVDRRDVVKGHPEYRSEKPGFRFDIPWKTEFVGEQISICFYDGERKVHEHRIRPITQEEIIYPTRLVSPSADLPGQHDPSQSR